eukprot:gb/GECG01003633.1/.p1 GENE.gb/GECG01003633.1/~~gb/GECG01003633.1/.p1  ORF type:complete len:534 (+),score=123.63 gb/GECG01003633.1/:1-1602(+)
MAALGEQKPYNQGSTLSPTSGDGAYYGFGASPKAVQPFRSARTAGSSHGRAQAGRARGENISGKSLGGTTNKPRRKDNIAYDKRVKRSDGMEEGAKYRTTGALRNSTNRSPTSDSLGERMANAKPPPPTNNHVDLTPYLVEQTEPPAKVDEETEVDEFLEQEPEPTEKHIKRGVDAATQIEPTDLWDFDVEVEPLLQVIVGKTLEQGMREVSEEDELNWLKHRGHEISMAKKKEVENVESLEEKAKSYIERKNEQLQKQKQLHRDIVEAKRKISSLSAARRAIASAKEASILRCKHSRNFVDSEELVFEQSVAEGTYNDVVGYLHQRAVARAIVDSLARRAVQHSAEVHENYVRDKEEAERKEAERHRQRSLKRKYKIRITIYPPKWLLDRWERKKGESEEVEEEEVDEDAPIKQKDPKPVVIGPIPVRRMDSVAAVQEKLREEVVELVTGCKELPEQGIDEEEEEGPIELGNIQWLHDVELQLFMHNHALDPTHTLEAYKKQDLLKGLGVRVVRKEPENEEEADEEAAGENE